MTGHSDQLTTEERRRRRAEGLRLNRLARVMGMRRASDDVHGTMFVLAAAPRRRCRVAGASGRRKALVMVA